MKKFWNVSKPTNEIYIYGEIVSDPENYAEITATGFAFDLNCFNGEPITVRINSRGGEIFPALAMYNLLKNYEGEVTVIIDGICASAATLVACAGKKIYMAKNAMYMTHLPKVSLDADFTEKDLCGINEVLGKLKNIILEIYAQKMNKKFDEVALLLESEVWYTAEEAKKLGFVDELIEEPPLQVTDIKNSIYNSLMAKEETRLSNENLLTQIKNLLNRKKDKTDSDEIRNAEIFRLKGLNNKRGTNPVINAIIDAAIKKGTSIEDIQEYLDAVAKVNYRDIASQEILNLIEDNLTSGGAEVGGNFPLTVQNQSDLVVKYANGGK